MRSKQPEPDINVTPLVDVVLVLLIIFMVIAPQLEHGQRVELPSVLQPDAQTKAKLDPITLSVARTGDLFLEKERVEGLPALRARLEAVRKAQPERRIVIKGDASVRYGAMRDAFAVCQGLGFPGVSLSVSQRVKGAAPREG
jgi:biopolymer transport protein TolR